MPRVIFLLVRSKCSRIPWFFILIYIRVVIGFHPVTLQTEEIHILQNKTTKRTLFLAIYLQLPVSDSRRLADTSASARFTLVTLWFRERPADCAAGQIII